MLSRFGEPGVHTVRGTWQGPEGPVSGELAVTVVGGAFASRPAAAWIRRTRDWDNGTLPAGLVYEGDPGVEVADRGPLPGGGRRLGLRSHHEGARHVLARIGGGGAILDSKRVEAFANYSSSQVYVRQAAVLADGTRELEMGVWGAPPHDGMQVNLSMHTAGAVFGTGSATLNLDRGDFDAGGLARVRVFLDPGVNLCHRLRIYQDGVLVGDRD